MPRSAAVRAAFSAATCAANGVPLREPLNPTAPALATHREIASVSQPAVAAEIDQTLDAAGHVAAKIALHLVAGVDHAPQASDLVVAQVVALPAGLDLRLGADGERRAPADAVDVGQSDLHAFLVRQVDASDACHCPSLSLSLFVAGVRAENAHHPLPPDDLAVLADGLD